MMQEALIANVDQMKLLSFSNAIMMETSLSVCLTHVIDAVYEAVAPDSCVVFMVDDNLQFMSEHRHSAYRTARKPRKMTTRAGIGQKVLSSENKWLIIPDLVKDSSEMDTDDPYLVPMYESTEEAAASDSMTPYPCILYTAIHDHTGRPLGLVETCSKTPGKLTKHDTKIIRAISLIAASAMRSARLHEEMMFARKHGDALLEISQALSGEIETADVIDRILKVAHDVVTPERVILYLVDEDTGDLVDALDDSPERETIKMGEGIEGMVAETADIFQSDDARNDMIFRELDSKCTSTSPKRCSETRNVICAPVCDPSGQVLAVIKAVNKQESGEERVGEGDLFFAKEDVTIVQAIAESAGVALHKAKLLDSIVNEQRKNKSLISVMKAVNKSKDNVDELVQNLVAVAYDIIEVDRVTLFLVDEAAGELICTVTKDKNFEGARIPVGKGIAGVVAANGKTICIHDASNDERHDCTHDEKTGYVTKNILCMSIRDHRNRIVAVIELLNKKNGHFDSHDEDVLLTFSEEVASALKRVVLEKAFRHAGAEDDSNILGMIAQYSNKVLNKPRKKSNNTILPGQATVLLSPTTKGRLLGVQGPVGTGSGGDWEKSAVNIKKLATWEFDVLAYDKKTLLLLCNQMLHHNDLTAVCNVDQNKVQNFLVSVSNGYRDNAFHSFFHAAAVMHVSYMMLSVVGCEEFLEPRDSFAVLVAAICHDLDHPGTTNDFAKNSLSSLALLYNDRSILENHHAAMAFKTMQEPDKNILANLSSEDFKYTRKMIIELILKTDMANHFDMIKNMQLMADKIDTESGDYFSIDNDDHRMELAGLVVHCADLSNPAYPHFEMTRQWCFRVCEEFSKQAALEESMGLPVTPFMEGLSSERNIAKLQIGFVNYVILPLWKVTGLLFPKSAQQSLNCVNNVKRWQDIIDNGESPNALTSKDGINQGGDDNENDSEDSDS